MSAHDWRADGRALGLLDVELDAIHEALGRIPNRTELTIFSGMWSEHCSYKSTRHWLKDLPRDGARVLAGPGSHAGVVDVGEGWAVAFKVESHNHPSAVEPYQGAATGVGGILRDVIAQGARPCAVMDFLCFGEADAPRTKHLASGIVGGIAGYGNAFGVPNIGGRTRYDRRYDGNPLVNALAAGLVRPDAMRHGRAEGVGNAVLYVGASTGLDGILGAAFASEELGHDTVQSRTHVQVGDPFMGKKIMEACLSFSAELGMLGGQDMGACGLSCALFETAAGGNVGMEVDLDRVPLREADMTAHEIMLSESQERFLFIVKTGSEAAAVAHFEKYAVHAAIIGRVTADGVVRVRYKGETAVTLPAALVAGGGPAMRWPVAETLPAVPPYPDFAAPADAGETLLGLLSEAGMADLTPVFGRYDQTVGNRTVRGPGDAEASVQKLPASQRGFALTLTGRGDLCAVDPYRGAQALLAEAMLDLACVGADMVAITDGLNIGSPRDPVENLRLRETIRGLGDGLRALGVPVTGGNVSLYNESPQGAIPPTPVIGALGIVADVKKTPGSRCLAAGDVLFLLGEASDRPTLSRYGRARTERELGPMPRLDLAATQKLARFLITQVEAGRVHATKATGSGGLGVALAKLCGSSKVGARLELPRAPRVDWLLFSESPGGALWAAVPAAEAEAFAAAATEAGVPCQKAGTAGGDRLTIAGVLDLTLARLAAAFAPAATKEAKGRSVTQARAEVGRQA